MGPDEELYGLRIAQNAGRKAGSVYPILARLEEAGWVESSWEREERGERGPRRRFYRLVPDGLAAARPAGRSPRRRPAAHRQGRTSGHAAPGTAPLRAAEHVDALSATGALSRLQ